MSTSKSYLFCSDRLGFRNWKNEDLLPTIEMNQDPEVMRYFPSLQTKAQSIAFIERMQALFSEKAYCYFAVDERCSGDFIGFIGLANQHFKASFTPCVDIGWRLRKKYWGKGYATEGAQRSLAYGLEELQLESIYSVAPVINQNSIRVMQKLNMKQHSYFKHPLLLEHEKLVDCVCYSIENT